jgi:hypothetical protein
VQTRAESDEGRGNYFGLCGVCVCLSWNCERVDDDVCGFGMLVMVVRTVDEESEREREREREREN